MNQKDQAQIIFRQLVMKDIIHITAKRFVKKPPISDYEMVVQLVEYIIKNYQRKRKQHHEPKRI